MVVSDFYELYGVEALGAKGGCLPMGVPSIYMMFGLNQAMHAHKVRGHVHCNSQSSTRLFWGH
jgi:hypothetical protein